MFTGVVQGSGNDTTGAAAGWNCSGVNDMPLSDVYAVASKDIVFESFDGEAVVLDLSNGKYFGFSDSGSKVWQALASGVGTEALIRSAAGAARIDAAALESFIGQLVEFGLLAPSGATPLPSSDDLPAALAAACEPLNVSVHDDLADLITVDPIHEVEEPLGWPAVKQVS
ncbi:MULTISPECIES: PqqD family protein [unclassified Mesorhizobium]|uniref:PqqD family protein n=1 Tax=unclassified Mesorhizobium TaxID=325217 RepID=UPI001FED79BC|nr:MULTISPECIES: PqqD family protein [unclassified Mesorhizobium]